MRTPGGRALHRDDGFVAAEWAAGTALLVVPVLLLAMFLPTWTARHEAAAAAARAGARVAARAATPEEARRQATEAAVATLRLRGYPAEDAAVEVEVEDSGTAPGVVEGVMPREGAVRVRVTLHTPGIPLPLVGAVSGPAVHGDHTRLLDPLRARAS